MEEFLEAQGVAMAFALVFAVMMLDLTLLAVHFIAARKRVRGLWRVAEKQVELIRSNSVERFRLISPCWKCGANVLHAFVQYIGPLVVRKCLFCHTEWKEERP